MNSKEDILYQCYELRQQGYNTAYVKAHLHELGLQKEEIKHILIESDELFLDSLQYKQAPSGKSNTIVKTLILVLVLIVLLLSFMGYFSIGFLILILIFALLKNSSLLTSLKKRKSKFKKNS